MGKASRTKWERRQSDQVYNQKAGTLPAWTPFVKGQLPPASEAMIDNIVLENHISRQEARRSLEKIRQTNEIYVNSRYQVNLTRYTTEIPDVPKYIELSIKRRDKKPVGKERFRDFQKIKNELVGEHCEGVELYPAEERLVDSANQYYMYVIDDPAFRWFFGMQGRRVTSSMEGNSVQEPFEE